MMGQPRQEPPNPWRAFAERLEPGAVVRVRLKDGREVTGRVIQVTADTLRVEPETRIRVPIRDFRFSDIQSLARGKEGMSPGKQVLIGVGVGVMAYLALMTALLSQAR